MFVLFEFLFEFCSMLDSPSNIRLLLAIVESLLIYFYLFIIFILPATFSVGRWLEGRSYLFYYFFLFLIYCSENIFGFVGDEEGEDGDVEDENDDDDDDGGGDEDDDDDDDNCH